MKQRKTGAKKKWQYRYRQERDHDFWPEDRRDYVVEFRTAEGEVLAISIAETAVIRHFQERMPHGLFVPDVQ